MISPTHLRELCDIALYSLQGVPAESFPSFALTGLWSIFRECRLTPEHKANLCYLICCKTITRFSIDFQPSHKHSSDFSSFLSFNKLEWKRNCLSFQQTDSKCPPGRKDKEKSPTFQEQQDSRKGTHVLRQSCTNCNSWLTGKYFPQPEKYPETFLLLTVSRGKHDK